MVDKEKVTLLPCAFKHADQDLEIQRFGEMFAVVCIVCAAIGPAADAPERAVMFWNHRDILAIPQENYTKLLEEQRAEEEKIISAYSGPSEASCKEGVEEKQDNEEGKQKSRAQDKKIGKG